MTGECQLWELRNPRALVDQGQPDLRGPGWLEPQLATLTKERFSDPAWIYERKLDGERCLAYRSGGQVLLLTRNRHDVSRTYPEVRRRAGRADGFRLRLRRGDRGVRRRCDQLQHAAATARGARSWRRAAPAGAGVLLRLRPALCRRPGPARAAVARAQGAAAREPVVLRFAPLHRASRGRRRGVLRVRVPARLGGPDRQARGRAVPGGPDQGLAEVQVRDQPGAADRRLHGPAGFAHALRRAAARLLRPAGPPGLRGQGRDRLQRGDAGQPGRLAARDRARGAAVRPRRCCRGRATADRRGTACTGSSRGSSRRWALPSGPVPGSCGIPAIRACGTTRTRRRSCASGL